MSKGQTLEKKIKNSLKFFKMNEDSISTLMGVVVIVIIAGLIFNYFKSANLKTWQGMLLEQQAPSTTTETKTEDKQAENNLEIYKVVKGDDLWHISEKFFKSGYNYVDIMKENNIGGEGVITAGMELIIPKVEAKKLTIVEIKKDILVKGGNFEATKTDDSSKVLAATTGTTLETGNYTTKKGDTLWNISVRAYGDGFKWTKIYWENRKVIGNPDVIFADVKITIPVLK
jgi:nucleoid-associated protein YgaU